MIENNIDEIIKKYKPLVVSIARKYFLAGAEIEDLIQEGMIGLFKAVQNYNDGMDASFATFANLCISRQIISAIKHANSDKNKVLNELSIAGDDGENTLNLIVSLEQNPEDKFISEESVKYIQGEIQKNLSYFERQILNLYIEGNRYEEIASKLNIDKKMVDNNLVKIRKKLSHLLKQ